ncbi:MAG TPA: hypothetical protein VKU19_21960 [Bryobacteraceae bacterium]|nr:hypothetical protein [Bryobacteraceae bacterium]
MRWIVPSLLIAGMPIALSAASGDASAENSAAEIASHVAKAERALPWLWSSTVEGVADISYTYKEQLSRRILTRNGKEVPPARGTSGLGAWRTLQFERVPLDWGAFLRCLSQDGASPCSKEWNQELERQVSRRDSLTPEMRAKIDATREERRQRRRDFWDDFPNAFRFEASGIDQLLFSPLPGYQTEHGAPDGLLKAISGKLTFDPSTFEITRLEYDLTRDVEEPFARLAKSAHFEIELMKVEEHYVPRVVATHKKAGKSGETVEETTVFSDYRRFGADSKILFGDPK